MSTVRALPAPSFPDRSGNVAQRPSRPPWPVLDKRALYGLSGNVVSALEEHTEADPVAMLVSFLAGFGSAVGPGPHARADGAQHPSRLFTVIVGQTAKARKGTSWNRVKSVLRAADEEWADRIHSGLSSGEGLVQAARNQTDQRVFVYEGEFVRVLKAAGRDGSTLSAILRDAWDLDEMRVMTKDPVIAKDRHVSMLSHITVEELHSSLSAVDTANGFANRFLFVCAKRARLLPSGGNFDDQELARLGGEVASAAEKARRVGRLHRDAAAEKLWADLYEQLAGDEPGGIVGGLVARSDAQLLRLSVAYALTDGSALITTDHLVAAYALWRYCRDSVAHIFGDSLGDPEADKVLAFLMESGGSVSRKDLVKAFSGHLSGTRLDRVLNVLAEGGRINRVTVDTGGRPGTVLVAL